MAQYIALGPLGNVTTSVRGTAEVVNTRLCWQARDEYYECIDKQGNGKIRL